MLRFVDEIRCRSLQALAELMDRICDVRPCRGGRVHVEASDALLECGDKVGIGAGVKSKRVFHPSLEEGRVGHGVTLDVGRWAVG